MVWFFKPVRSFVVYYGHFVIFASPINCQMMGRLYVILLYKGDWVRRLAGVNNIHLLTIVDFEQVLEPSCLLL